MHFPSHSEAVFPRRPYGCDTPDRAVRAPTVFSPSRHSRSNKCTFCRGCATRLGGVCPNCGGNLVARPIRPPEKLAKHPASIERVLKPGGCFAK